MTDLDTDSTPNVFSLLIAAYRSDPNVGNKKLFGFDCLRYKGELFLKLDNNEIVIKLPRQRVLELVNSKKMKPYKKGNGQTLKEWGVVICADKNEIFELVDEAKKYGGLKFGSGR